MDKDRAEGLGKKVTGSIKEALGKITGDRETQAAGVTEQADGAAQNAMGGARDAAKE